MRKVNDDPDCSDYESTEAFRASLPWDEERVDYIAERWDTTRNAARTLILCELDRPVHEIASFLYVTPFTVRGYIDELAEKIHVDALMSIEYKHEQDLYFDVWGGDPEKSVEYSGDFVDYDHPLNRGCDIEEVPARLIHVDTPP
jgi:hypothetical protein